MPIKVKSDWDWCHFIPSREYYRLELDEYRQWSGECLMVMMEIRKGKDRDSRGIALEFDDIATGQCFYRDWTSSGIPFVEDSEVYWSGFWFENRSDYDQFKKLYGGVGIYDSNFDEFVRDCNKRRRAI